MKETIKYYVVLNYTNSINPVPRNVGFINKKRALLWAEDSPGSTMIEIESEEFDEMKQAADCVCSFRDNLMHSGVADYSLLEEVDPYMQNFYC